MRFNSSSLLKFKTNFPLFFPLLVYLKFSPPNLFFKYSLKFLTSSGTSLVFGLLGFNNLDTKFSYDKGYKYSLMDWYKKTDIKSVDKALAIFKRT